MMRRTTRMRFLGRWLVFLGVLGCASPLTAQTAPSPRVVTGSLTAELDGACSATECASLVLGGNAAVALQVTGTWEGTLSFLCSIDGETFSAAAFAPLDSTGSATSTTANGQWQAVLVAHTCRVEFTTRTSGTAVVTLRALHGGGGVGAAVGAAVNLRDGSGNALTSTLGGSNRGVHTVAIDASGNAFGTSSSPVVVRGADPCAGLAKTMAVINVAAATTTEVINIAGASNHIYICAIHLVAGGAIAAALADDDTDDCVSVTAGLAGGVTAATGWTLAANAVFTLGTGTGTVLKTNGTNRSLCLVTSTTAQLSGTISYVIAP